LIFHAVDGQTHTSEAFAAALLLVAVLRYRRRPSIQWAVVLGLLLALGSALRPSFIVAGIGPIVWAIGFRRFPHLVIAGATSSAGALAWLLPTLRASGGLERWRAANDALVQGVFLRVNSPLSADSVDGFVLYSAANTALWLSLLLLPAVLVMLARGRSPRPSDPAYDEARAVALWTIAPAALFYLVTFSSEPGYFLGLMPAVVVLTVVGASGIPAFGRRRLAYTLAAVAQLGILMLPAAPPGVPIGKIPSIPDLVGREAVYRAALTLLGEQVPWDARVLGVATQDDWIPVPGPILLQTGPDTVRELPFVCDVNATQDELRARVLPARTCFPNGVIEVHGQGIRFQLPESPEAAVTGSALR
jgi:hypothetical protein